MGTDCSLPATGQTNIKGFICVQKISDLFIDRKLNPFLLKVKAMVNEKLAQKDSRQRPMLQELLKMLSVPKVSLHFV